MCGATGGAITENCGGARRRAAIVRGAVLSCALPIGAAGAGAPVAFSRLSFQIALAVVLVPLEPPTIASTKSFRRPARVSRELSTAMLAGQHGGSQTNVVR